MAEQRIYGLLGEDLSYSYSPRIHAMLGGYEYKLMEMSREDAAEFVKHGEWDGLNISKAIQK